MKKILFVCLVLVFVFPCVVEAFLLPTAKLTLKVVDEQGVPITGADVSISYEVPKAAGRGWGSRQMGTLLASFLIAYLFKGTKCIIV